LITYFIGNITAKKYQNPFMYVKVIASQKWDVFETRWIYIHTSILSNGTILTTISDNNFVNVTF